MKQTTSSDASDAIRVLLVEDDEEDYLLTRDLLARVPEGNYRLEWARSFQEGIAQLEERTFDVCLLDFRLGARDGLDFLGEATARHIHVPVMVLTGSRDPELDRALMNAGAAEFLEKGRLDPQLLERTIRYAIRQWRAERAQRLLADAGRALASSLEPDTVLGIAARVAVPGFADWSWISLSDPGPDRRAADVFHRGNGEEARLRLLLDLPSMPGEPSLIARVLEEAAPQLRRIATPAALSELTAGGPHLDILRGVDTGSVALVPLEVRGKVRGFLLLGRSGHRRPFDERDLSLARDLGTDIAMALENARLYQAAQEAVRMRNEVLSMVSHDLGNPLAAIVMVVQRLLEKPEGEASRTRAHLEMIRGSARSMVRLVEDLLAVGRAEAGHFTMDRHQARLGPVVARTVKQFRGPATEAGIRLEVDLSSVPPSLEIDAGRIGQVISNLLSNALKFTPPGGSVSIRVRDGEDEAVVSVEDTGPGIEAEDLAHLFDPFWQADKTRKGGAGLGLAIAHEIVGGHGGRIWVDSAPGRGSTFHFTVPHSRRAFP
ncbi:MAG: ATP-binding protein [Gemmatimonadota bacterium]